VTDNAQDGNCPGRRNDRPQVGTTPTSSPSLSRLRRFMEVLDKTIANVALRHIAGGVGVGIDEST